MTVSSIRFVFVVVYLFAFYAQVQEVIAQNSVSIRCLQCICETISGCENVPDCHGPWCGPYLITKSYWLDAGMPGKDKNIADEGYGKCVSDPSCASQSVQGFMNRYARDCNGDGVIDCDDYIRIHKYGADICNRIKRFYNDRVYNGCISRGIGPLDDT